MTAAHVSSALNDAKASRGVTIAFAGGLLLSLDVPLLKLSGADTFTIIYVRGAMLFAALFLYWLFFIRLRGDDTPFINGKTGMVLALLAGTANIMFVSSISMTSVANVVFILAFNPMFAGLLSWAVLGERLHVYTWLAIVASLAGVGIIVADGLQLGTWRGDLLALGVSFLLACSLTLVRYRQNDQSMSAATGHLLAAAVVAPFAAPLALSPESWGWLALNGLLVAPAATAMLMVAPRYVAAAVVAMFFLLETVLTPVWMWGIFGEIPSLLALLGGAVVISALSAHSLWKLNVSNRARRSLKPQQIRP